MTIARHIPASAPRKAACLRTDRARSARGANRRGLILVAVMIVIGIALLMAGTLLYVSQAEAAGAAAIRQQAQSRLMARSALEVLVRRLNAQRDVILEGRTPDVDDQYVMFESGDTLGVVRLLPPGPGDRLLIPEGGRLDVNHVDAGQLEATGLISAEQADAIIARRDERGRFQSVAELLTIPAITAEDLYGPLEDLRIESQLAGDLGDVGERMLARIAGDQPRGLADVITVFGVEPPLQRNGRLRINLNTPWSSELGDRIEDRFDREARQVLQALMNQGITFENESRIYEILNQFNVEPEEWPDVVDAFCSSDATYNFGWLDINTASYEALLGLPGVEPEQATEIVRRRDQISEDLRATIAWPAIEGVLNPEQYVELAGRITSRCWTYRLRLAAGYVDVDDAEGPLDNPVVFDVVIDLVDPQARIAYLRDITMLNVTARLVGELEMDDPFAADAAGVPLTADDLGEGVPVGADAIAGADSMASIPEGWDEIDWPADEVTDEADTDPTTQEGGAGAAGGAGEGGGADPADPGRLGRWTTGN